MIHVYRLCCSFCLVQHENILNAWLQSYKCVPTGCSKGSLSIFHSEQIVGNLMVSKFEWHYFPKRSLQNRLPKYFFYVVYIITLINFSSLGNTKPTILLKSDCNQLYSQHWHKLFGLIASNKINNVNVESTVGSLSNRIVGLVIVIFFQD